ncbi:hypothetical protein DWB85_01625 [Seongchinamella sediminis]|uniref:Peptidase M11 gametolysin domain-containing protein n=1 Tax=Seongchinamella sediminis TaxID=2283635 RepID=A0A3L7E376_9GAMM|nr:hypothetical protein [Seongchinamella sediminis]RLQ23280.1 hypothetical protein DWB85_01625 [Seongchinamella sediminis]
MKATILSTLLGLAAIQFTVSAQAAPPNGLPENARVELSGTLQVFIREDLPAQTAAYEYYLERGQGKAPVRLIFNGSHPATLRSGVGIAVRGMVREGNVEVTAANIEEGGDASGVMAESTQAFTLDARSALVVIVNASDESHTSEDLGNMDSYYFGSANSMADMYDRISFGQLAINGIVVGPITVSETAQEVCADPFAYASSWLDQAEGAFGIDRNNYRHRIFAVPRGLSGGSCGWTGYANVGCGTACSAFNRWSHDINTTSHEFGHNLGLAHAGVGSNQYADMSSFMGYSTTSGVRALDSAHHWQLGWFADIDAATTQRIQGSGSYDIAPLREISPAGNAPSIYRIDVASGDPYFLSARVPEGYDTGLATLNSAALNGVNIHRYAGSGYDLTDRVAQLDNGQSYTDSVNNLTITQLARAADGTVTVTVDMGEGECVPSAPGLSANPTFGTVGPGDSYDFPVTLVNNDSGFCDPRTFTLATDQGGLSATSVNLAPGAQGGSLLTLVGGASSGDTVASVSVAGESTPPVAVMLTVDATAPTISGLIGSYERKGKNHRIQLSWSGSDDSGSVSYAVLRNGAQIATTGQGSYTDSLPKSPDASYAYQVRAVDPFGNEALSATIDVATSGGDDGDGGGGGDKPCRGKKCGS